MQFSDFINPANLALVAGFVLCGPAQAENHGTQSTRVASLTAGLFCAPEDGARREAPDTLAGWIHVPEAPIELIAEGQVVPARIGVGFGVRYSLTDTSPTEIRYTVTHPPMPPSGQTSQSWNSFVSPGGLDTALFQFDYDEELQPGDWSFSASTEGEVLFTVEFTILPSVDLPSMAGLCGNASLLSSIPGTRAAAG